jgi:hypothetical protein
VYLRTSGGDVLAIRRILLQRTCIYVPIDDLVARVKKILEEAEPGLTVEVPTMEAEKKDDSEVPEQ